MNARSHKRSKTTAHWADRKKEERKEQAKANRLNSRMYNEAEILAAKAREESKRKEKEMLENTSLKNLIK